MNLERIQRRLNDPDTPSGRSRMLVDEYVEDVIGRSRPTKNPADSDTTCTVSPWPTGSDAGGQTRILMNADKEQPKPGNQGSGSGGNQDYLPSPTGYGHSLGMQSVSGGSSGVNPFSTPSAPNDYPCKCYRCSVCGGKQAYPNQPYPPIYITPNTNPYIQPFGTISGGGIGDVGTTYPTNYNLK